MPLSDFSASLEEVAAALGRAPDWVMRNWLKIHREHGFPRKHPTGWTWPRPAVEAWLAGVGPDEPLDPANDNPFQSREAAYMAALDQRYGGNP